MIDTDKNIILEEESTVTKHSTKSDSVRTVIPQNFAKNMGVTDKDKVKWKLLTKDDKTYILVEKSTC